MSSSTFPTRLPATKLREARVRALLTQEQLAVAAGITSKSVCEIELGRWSPRFSTLHKLAAVLGCEAADLVDEEEVAA